MTARPRILSLAGRCNVGRGLRLGVQGVARCAIGAVTAAVLVLGVLASPAPAETAPQPGAPFTPAVPQPTGPHPIGRTTLHLIDDDRRDPWKPDRVRELMATVTYPARRVERYPRSPWFSRAVAEDLERSLADPPTLVEPGSVDLARARAHARAEAPVARLHGWGARGWPVVLFSPGGGTSREQNTAQIEDIASRGYVVVSFDHTYEAPAVEFPDGRVARQVPDFLSDDPKVLRVVFKRAIDARVADTRLVLDRLADLDRGRNPDAHRRRLPPGLRGALELSRLGMFGYSYGGYTAGEAMVGDRRIDAGVNLDGAMAHGFGLSEDWPYAPGEVARRGLDRPFMLFGNENHNHLRGGAFPAGGDPSWRDFWTKQRGPKLDITLRQSEHGSFQDLQFGGPQIIRALDLPPTTLGPSIGTIDPDRSIAAQRAYVASFFDLYLRHRDDHLLDGPSPAYPEIEFVR
jgi:Platelet-activating factor acetylhydrolase, isoform II